MLKKNESYSEILSGLKGNNLICITINTEDKNSVFQLGIIEPDGTNRYIECNGMANHQFEVNRSGDYKLYITNIGEIDTEIIVSIMVAPK